MKIVKLLVENIKRIIAVEMHPEGNMVVIGGENAQGKSSVLDAITMALRGKAAFTRQPVHQGAERGQIVAELDDLVVTRTITADGNTTLVVASRDGARYPSPQSVLNKLVGALSFDPLAFVNQDAKKQLESVRGLVGLDFTELDTQRQALYDERTGVNRDARRAQDLADSMPSYPEAPAEQVNALELLDRREAINKHNKKQEQRGKNIEKAQEDVEAARDEVSKCLKELAAAESELATAQENVAAAKADLATAQDEQANQERDLGDLPVPVEPQSTDEVDAELASINQVNEQVTANRQKADAKAMADGFKEAAARLTELIQGLDEQKAQAMAEAKFPVPGLGFDEQGITFNGLPFSEASSAEQLRVSVAMGLAMNPTLKVLLIRDGSLLDNDNLRMVGEMAAEADAQVWVERVGEGEEVSVVIEDGAVKDAPESAAA